MIDELLRTKSPRVIVIGVDDHPSIDGHPGFKLVAPAWAILAPPAPLLHSYVYDLANLPSRQVELFAARFLPGLFNLRLDFDPAAYASTQTDYSSGAFALDGKPIDMEKQTPREELLAGWHPDDPELRVGNLELWCCNDGDDRVYTRAIAAEAKARGVRLIFAFVPDYGLEKLENRDFLSRYGAVLDNGYLARDPNLFMNFWHLNHSGALANSDRIAEAVSEQESADVRPSSAYAREGN